MSKTIKDKANYFKHHLEQDYPMAQKSKFKIKKSDIPEDIKPMLDKLNYSYKNALRHGNNRKYYADVKVQERREERNKGKELVRNEVAMIFQ